MDHAMMTPEILDLWMDIEDHRFSDVLVFLQSLFREAGRMSIATWAIPASAELRAEPVEEALAALEDTDESERLSLRFELEDGGVGAVSPGRDAGSWRIRIHQFTDGHTVAAWQALLGRFVDMCRALAASDVQARARVEWNTGAECGVEVPIAGIRAQAIVTTEAIVAREYHDPEAFWAVWEQVESLGDNRLVTRALEARDAPELLERIIDGQWALARAARPGKTHYFAPDLVEEEVARYRPGGRHLQMVGYDPATQRSELACALEPGQHVNGWEVIESWRALRQRRLPDGRPLQETRVVFLERQAAEANLRPLCDIGARVFYTDEAGVDVELT